MSAGNPKKILAVIMGYFVSAQIILAQPTTFGVTEAKIGYTEGRSFRKIVYEQLGGVFQTIYTLLIGIAFLFIIIGIVRYFAPGGQEQEKRKTTIFILTWGLLSFIILISVLPVLSLVMRSFSFS